MTRPAAGDARALRERIGDVLFDLRKRLRINERPLVGLSGKAIAHGELCDRGAQFRHERIVNRVLHEQTIGADTGLAGVPVLARNCPGDRRIKVGILEHEKRCVAAEFQGELLQCAHALGHQPLAHFG